jgi:hypothetical protein
LNSDSETTDLEKTLYFCLEKMAENSHSTLDKNDFFQTEKTLKSCIYVYYDSNDRIDFTFSVYNDIHKFLNQYKNDLETTDTFLVSGSSMSIFLKEGVNIIYPSEKLENKNLGYSLVTLNGEAKCKLYEYDNSLTGKYSIIAGNNI